jgi:hypothetical protein
MLNTGIHYKPAGVIFEHYLDCLDKGDTLSFEKDLVTWMKNSKNKILKLELRRIWYRIIDGDIKGARTMVLELQEQYIDHRDVEVPTTFRFLDRRLKEKGY